MVKKLNTRMNSTKRNLDEIARAAGFIGSLHGAVRFDYLDGGVSRVKTCTRGVQNFLTMKQAEAILTRIRMLQ